MKPIQRKADEESFGQKRGEERYSKIKIAKEQEEEEEEEEAGKEEEDVDIGMVDMKVKVILINIVEPTAGVPPATEAKTYA